MRNKICLALGLTLSFVAGVSAQTTTYKITKVGSEENQSFDVLLNGKVITEAKQGDWPNVSPIVPDGKMFIGFTVYEEYGETREDQKELTVGRNGLRFLMPKKDVYVRVSYESLRYSIKANSAENGSVSFSFNDRVEMTDRTKPGNKVTVSPKADKGYKVSSIKVSKYLDPNTTVTCTAASGAGHAGPGAIPGAAAAEGSCSFEMPYFDVDITATFVDEKTDVKKEDLKGKKFSITYKLNEGKLPKDAAESYSCESEATLPIPTRDGFDFVGWSWTNKLDNVYYAIKTLDGMRCADTTLYAIWTPKGSCMEQKAVAVDSAARMPVCSSNIRCALIHSNTTKQDSVCDGIVWTTDMGILSSSSSVVSSSSVAASSSSAKPASSSVAASSSSAKPASSSVAASSSSAKPASSSVAASSSSAKPASSSVAASSSSAKPASSSVAASSSSAKPASSSAAASSSSAKPASSSVAASSSSAKPASSSVAASSSSAKPASSSAKASSSSAKPASSSAKATSSSAKAKSSSSVELDVESVKTEEDLPNCTAKRENVTYYVSELKKVFVCKDKKWTKFDPSGIPVSARLAKFSVTANGHSLLISGAKIGSQVSLFDMQGRVMYNGRTDVSDFSLKAPRTGSFLLRIGTQQKIVNVR
ncbi:MAG: InlB B-repeat-containing protein [Fibrobacter sp.]|nr:InlB B-repeat-containing protein [Fibrobacter sp.]